ncbi:hypothetical protein OEB99_04630 [Actinotalea sp. M2MS4P-6]|uniref:hypothetical protein n=1 Tax=Actinotalea sp. M2MS4P-6 TaxID=2983762 RepID=UPI0021E4BAED|nr:hypothetical protein [Actinotalea sp. M2MS4P-6]MCV2393586.1 hypothetical protein [Actinotalea sp. M2MS4P-6]
MNTIIAALAAVPRIVVRGIVALSALCAIAALAVAIDPTWIESVLGASPDGGSGEAEWALVLGLAAASLTLAVMALAAIRSRRSVAIAR